uniref:5'-(N(7)-methylguanosine 5'-triphospho)-[mRNA] hydrolase n=1 Tax=Phocoena sinus TaxID=42100 RepID=A0A8C9C8V6_PHOSS
MAAAAAAGYPAGKGRDISLAALRRHDPYISRIVDVASQVALYTFGHRANEWEKTDVEGTLFVYTRSASPKHGFTIMNRLSMENRTEPITKDLDFQLQDPFLLYRNARSHRKVDENVRNCRSISTQNTRAHCSCLNACARAPCWLPERPCSSEMVTVHSPPRSLSSRYKNLPSVYYSVLTM